MFTKIVKQNFPALKNGKQNGLYENINKFLPDATDEVKGIVAGLCIEYVIKSKGNPDVFLDEMLVTISTKTEEDIEEMLDSPEKFGDTW